MHLRCYPPSQSRTLPLGGGHALARQHCILPHRASHPPRRRSKEITRALAASLVLSEPLAKPPFTKVLRDDASWLEAQEPFDALPASVCNTLASAVQKESFPGGQPILSDGQKVVDLLIVRSGSVQSTGPAPATAGAWCMLVSINSTYRYSRHMPFRNVGHAGPGSILALPELLSGERTKQAVRAAGPVTLWRVPQKAFKAAAVEHPDLALLLFRAGYGSLSAQTDALQACTGTLRCCRDSLRAVRCWRIAR